MTGQKAPLVRPPTKEELVLPLVNVRLAKADIRLSFPDYRSYEREWDYRHDVFSVSGGHRLYRQFVDDEQSGGRLFGHWGQTVPKRLRRHLTINGEHVFEYDYQGMQAALAYDLVGEEAPPGDPYDIPGYGKLRRDDFKACFTSAIGADQHNPNHNLMSAFSHAVKKQTGSWLQEGEAERMADAFWEYHAPLNELAGTQAWRQLQLKESQLMLKVLAHLEEEGVTAIPIHDAALVPISQERILKRAMMRARCELDNHVSVHPAKWMPDAFPHLF
ncbi:hypothetical protein [Devosia sp. SD17-2]|uniref:hypothetical protein n=1 Tax=Devosia sp. SD17-2 TaxID=2976459 RepID=UPI0023D89D98|nr:hypothetical protein [Devosia sp. SD17-2]WEJ33383.1 hypothetical protein NYQ88_00740 [Devosia sp. SD17-2]